MRRFKISITQTLGLFAAIALVLALFMFDRSEIHWIDSVGGEIWTGSSWFDQNQYQMVSHAKIIITDRDVRKVRIRNRRLSRTEIARLRGFPNLECVRLLGQSFDETVLDELARCSKLKIVDIRDTNIGDRGFRTLTEIPQIQCIAYINSAVSEGAALEASKRRPDITFLGWYF